MLTHRCPARPDRGDRIRGHHLLRVLSRRFDVDLACTSDTPVTGEDRRTLHALVDRLAIEPIGPIGGTVRAVRAIGAGDPITPAWHHRKALARRLDSWHREIPFDVVLCICTGMLDYARGLLHPRSTAWPHGRPTAVREPTLLLDLVDVDSRKWRCLARRSRPPRRWLYRMESTRLRRVEKEAVRFCDALTVVSNHEALAFRRHVEPTALPNVVGNGVDLEHYEPLADPATRSPAFVGVLDYEPNVEGIRWFVHEVLPALQRRSRAAGRLKLFIASRRPCRKIWALEKHPAVTILGSVADVRRVLEKASVVIAPLRMARGIQNKVLEAMACGRPVICSPQAPEGIDARAGEHLVVADQPEQWAQSVDELLSNPERRKQLSLSARALVERRYGWARRLAPMADLITTLAEQRARTRTHNFLSRAAA